MVQDQEANGNAAGTTTSAAPTMWLGAQNGWYGSLAPDGGLLGESFSVWVSEL